MNRFHNSLLSSSVFRSLLFCLPFFTLAHMHLCSPAVVFSQQRWERTYGGAGNDLGRSVHQTFDGGYIVAGWTYSFGAGDADVYLIKTDPSGDTVWTRTYGGPLFEDGYYVAQTSDSGYIIVGSTTSFGAGSNDVYLIKADASGDTIWTRTYGETLNDYSHSIAQTRDSNYVLARWTNSFGAGSYDVYLIKTDASGDTVWTRTYGGPSEDYGIFVTPTTDSGCVIAGLTSSYGVGGYDIYLIKTDVSGDTVWTKTYGGPLADWGYCVAQTTDGGYIIAGDRDNQSDAWLLKTNALGDTTWTKTYGGPNQESADAVAQTADGGYIITGYTTSYGAGGEDVYLIKTDANGNAAVEKESKGFEGPRVQEIKITPNPFISFASVPGHKAERFSLYDISGRKVGTYKGDRIGEGLEAGVYFLRPEGKDARPLRVVKLR